jgi:hypothetical protein
MFDFGFNLGFVWENGNFIIKAVKYIEGS